MLRLKDMITLIIGLLLILVSANPLFLMGQEYYYGNRASQGTKIERIYVNSMELDRVQILGKGAPIAVEQISVNNYLGNGNEFVQLHSYEDYNRRIYEANTATMNYAREYVWQGNRIRLEDKFRPGMLHENSRDKSSLHITINGQDWSAPQQITIRPNFLDENRYHGYFGLLVVEERGEESVVLVQRLAGNRAADLVWRTLAIQSDGQVDEEQFSYEQRADVLQRVIYINYTNASPISLGFKSNILQGWPSLFFPLFYPFVTAFIGLILVFVGGLSIWIVARKKRGRRY